MAKKKAKKASKIYDYDPTPYGVFERFQILLGVKKGKNHA